jgi:hypothetical protein
MIVHIREYHENSNTAVCKACTHVGISWDKPSVGGSESNTVLKIVCFGGNINFGVVRNVHILQLFVILKTDRRQYGVVSGGATAQANHAASWGCMTLNPTSGFLLNENYLMGTFGRIGSLIVSILNVFQ